MSSDIHNLKGNGAPLLPLSEGSFGESRIPGAITLDARLGMLLPTSLDLRVVERYPDHDLQLAYRDVEYAKLLPGNPDLPLRREDCGWLEKAFWRPPIRRLGRYREFFFLDRKNKIVADCDRKDPRAALVHPADYLALLEKVQRTQRW